MDAKNAFEVTQDTVKKFTITFDKKVASLGEVKVDRVFKSGNVETKFASAVKAAKLADDGMSATVEMYGAMADKTDYIVYVDGFDPYTLTASQGAPESIAIYVSDKEIGTAAELVPVTEAPSTLSFRLYDGKGVDVTDVMSSDASVIFNSETYSTDGSYYVSDNQIWFSKELVEVKVLAQYNSGKWENGEQVGCFGGEKTFLSYKKDPISIVGIENYKIAGDWDKATKYVPIGEAATIALKVKLSEGDPKEVTGNTVTVGDITYLISYETVTPNIAGLNGNNVVFFKQGTAQFVVYAEYSSNGNTVKNAIGMISVEAKEAKGIGSASLSTTNEVLSDLAPYNTVDIKVTAKDNYGGDYTLTKEIKVEGADDNAKKAMGADNTLAIAVNGSTITVNGSQLLDNLGKDTATVSYKVKVEEKIDLAFTITVKTPDVTKTYLNVVAEGFGGNIARTVDSKDAKTGSFTVYKMNNGVKAGVQAIEKYNKDAVTAGAYYFTVTKDGVNITDKVDDTALANGKVIINFSGVKEEVVTYDLGAGSYVFTLYKGVAAGTKAVAVQQQSVAGTVTKVEGNYGAAVKNAAAVKSADDADIRAIFTVKDTKGNDAKDKEYTVKKQVAADYVYVESFTFYDVLDSESKAAYTVPVGYAIPIDPNAQ